MQEIGPRATLQQTVEKLSALGPRNAALSALRSGIPDISVEGAERMLQKLDGLLKGEVTPSPIPTELQYLIDMPWLSALCVVLTGNLGLGFLVGASGT
jgi:hypothetical protein